MMQLVSINTGKRSMKINRGGVLRRWVAGGVKHKAVSGLVYTYSYKMARLSRPPGVAAGVVLTYC